MTRGEGPSSGVARGTSPHPCTEWSAVGASACLRPAPAPERRRGSSQPVVQVAELRVKEAGLPVLPVWVAWKPKPAEAPAAMVAL
ncbi:hypothetical protein SAMN05216276_1005216 [Streptosporangium subroseum]|uniref:Uncharacterized protein n=1 Tax=Streptosporangium subroseum TaxID=106412 RepID=A0A239CHI7_9ACTN|nr:hypothetical protein SAMN05216276_1005216 [Streptosporangium subroseum]